MKLQIRNRSMKTAQISCEDNNVVNSYMRMGSTTAGISIDDKR
ncbi:hypothetical protein C942_04152 [Photobacterium marinum]|uniref:Uncharacterized protein n=1 Tax=Photobacterium marinum TaxID=1056511 RepID=L8JG09_9GAMM|nr:hypothetical protein C942_04152 [Photobacterium marinum]